MRFDNVQDVKKWLRNIPFVKREIELKTKFYRELGEEFERTPNCTTSVEFYKSQIERLQMKMKSLLADTERLFNILDDNERTVMTARYINLIRWDYIEFHVYYSRRQAIRVHDRAILKLVGQTVSEE